MVMSLFILDVIGLMTGISAEREYVRDGKVTKMIVFELTDDRYVSTLSSSYLVCVYFLF
jgi:hypothetical protein